MIAENTARFSSGSAPQWKFSDIISRDFNKEPKETKEEIVLKIGNRLDSLRKDDANDFDGTCSEANT